MIDDGKVHPEAGPKQADCRRRAQNSRKSDQTPIEHNRT
jgi:hypothetical protein